MNTMKQQVYSLMIILLISYIMLYLQIIIEKRLHDYVNLVNLVLNSI